MSRRNERSIEEARTVPRRAREPVGTLLRYPCVQYEGPIRFGDHVRVRDTQATREFGLAGLSGQVFGETTPSVSDVRVIGIPAGDYAINVQFDGRNENYWFAADLLDLVDHAPGTEIRIGGRHLVRESDGGWRESSAEVRPSSGTTDKRRRWWRFW